MKRIEMSRKEAKLLTLISQIPEKQISQQKVFQAPDLYRVFEQRKKSLFQNSLLNRR